MSLLFDKIRDQESLFNAQLLAIKTIETTSELLIKQRTHKVDTHCAECLQKMSASFKLEICSASMASTWSLQAGVVD